MCHMSDNERRQVSVPLTDCESRCEKIALCEMPFLYPRREIALSWLMIVHGIPQLRADAITLKSVGLNVCNERQ